MVQCPLVGHNEITNTFPMQKSIDVLNRFGALAPCVLGFRWIPENVLEYKLTKSADYGKGLWVLQTQLYPKPQKVRALGLKRHKTNLVIHISPLSISRQHFVWDQRDEELNRDTAYEEGRQEWTLYWRNSKCSVAELFSFTIYKLWRAARWSSLKDEDRYVRWEETGVAESTCHHARAV